MGKKINDNLFIGEETKVRTMMTVPEMGKLLGLGKTERYWLLRKNFFEYKEVLGELRVDIPSFEKWYANQVRYKKINGEEPGRELKKSSYSIFEIAEMLELTDGVVYDLLKKNNIETIIVDHWKRVPKNAFYEWYNHQQRYRTKEDKVKDAAIENATLSIPEMAKYLGVARQDAYAILNNSEYKDLFEIVYVAERKRITRKSFENFLKAQKEFRLDKRSKYKKISWEENIALVDYYRRTVNNTSAECDIKSKKYLSYEEAASIANVSKSTIVQWGNKGYIPIIHIMNIARIPSEDLKRYLKTSEKGV